MKQLVNQILSDATGKDMEQIENDTDRDYILTAGEAKEYGIIDDILTSRV